MAAAVYERGVMAVALVLPVPLLAAAGLSMPLPDGVYRLGVAAVEQTAAVASALPSIHREQPAPEQTAIAFRTAAPHTGQQANHAAAAAPVVAWAAKPKAGARKTSHHAPAAPAAHAVMRAAVTRSTFAARGPVTTTKVTHTPVDSGTQTATGSTPAATADQTTQAAAASRSTPATSTPTTAPPPSTTTADPKQSAKDAKAAQEAADKAAKAAADQAARDAKAAQDAAAKAAQAAADQARKAQEAADKAAKAAADQAKRDQEAAAKAAADAAKKLSSGSGSSSSGSTSGPDSQTTIAPTTH